MNDPRRYAVKLAEEDPLNDGVTAAVASGRLLAVATIGRSGEDWHVSRHRSRMFHLGERSQASFRKFAAEVHAFVTQHQVEQLAFCHSSIREEDASALDGAIIQALMCMIPRLHTNLCDEDRLLEWLLREGPPLPREVVYRDLTVAQVRAIELAQFSHVSDKREQVG